MQRSNLGAKKMGEEHKIMHDIIEKIVSCGKIVLRVNVGMAWTGNKIIKHKKAGSQWVNKGDLTIKSPRPFKSGMPKGTSDLIVLEKVKITEEMVGKEICKISFIEVKKEGGKISKEQERFLNLMREYGAAAIVARNAQDDIKEIYGSIAK